MKWHELQSFIETLSEKIEVYKKLPCAQEIFTDERMAELRHEQEHLQRRMSDERLYVGVVGEFSSGKSTFINALLGLDILKEDILQGTTCAPTLLSYAPAFDVDIVMKQHQEIISYSRKP